MRLEWRKGFFLACSAALALALRGPDELSGPRARCRFVAVLGLVQEDCERAEGTELAQGPRIPVRLAEEEGPDLVQSG